MEGLRKTGAVTMAVAIGLLTVYLLPVAAATTCNGFYCVNFKKLDADTAGGEHWFDSVLGRTFDLVGALKFNGDTVDHCTVFRGSDKTGCTTGPQDANKCVAVEVVTGGHPLNPSSSSDPQIVFPLILPVEEIGTVGC